MNDDILRAIKTFEGFTPSAHWDYAQYSNGYGTKALHPGEKIDEQEANRRFMSEIAQARAFVERHAGQWDEGTKSALTSLTFNAGTRWASSGLGEAVRNGDADAVRSRFLLYTKAGGQDLPGLVRRRLQEVTWIGNGQIDEGAGTKAAASTALAHERSPSRSTSAQPAAAVVATAEASSVSASVAPKAETASPAAHVTASRPQEERARQPSPEALAADAMTAHVLLAIMLKPWESRANHQDNKDTA